MSDEPKEHTSRLLKLLNKLWIHVFVFVWDVQHMDGFSFNQSCELGNQPRFVLLFHDEDYVSPADVFR